MAGREAQRRTEPGTAARAARRGATWVALVGLFGLGFGSGWAGARLGADRPPNEVGRTATMPGLGGAAGAAAPDADDASLAERILPLDPFIVNLAGDEASRYLKVKVELEAGSPEQRGELEARLPQVRDGILSVLSAREVADVTSFEGKALLKEDIQTRLDGLLREGRLRAVLFTEFVVQ